MGLIQRAIEAEGIPTISISLNRSITEKVKPPRALVVAFPLGHPMGNPFHEEMQREILTEGLRQLAEIGSPGTIVDFTRIYRVEGEECEVCRVDV